MLLKAVILLQGVSSDHLERPVGKKRRFAIGDVQNGEFLIAPIIPYAFENSADDLRRALQ